MNSPEPIPSVEPPPSGWLAFLFTDIEGSTALYERVGAGLYDPVRLRHHALLRAAVARHGGHAFKETGDGFLVAFADPAQAIAGAVAAQRALAAEVWAEEIRAVRVRMGIHWGHAVYGEGGDYHGLTLHRASRVLSAGHGGQILCTGALLEALPVDARKPLADLGLYRLRDVPDPVRLYQVVFPGMREDFPPPRAHAAFTENLPLVSTRFFGRDEEIRQLMTRLAPMRDAARDGHSGGRLVTLLGPGGTGKTRLALTVAERLLHAFDHAVWFVPLAEVRDPALLAETVRDALRLAPDPAAAPLEQVVAELRAQPSLLVLDNYEQLAAAGAGFVSALLERLPQLVCLVTSRQRLDLGAEREFQLQPLRLPLADSTAEELERTESAQLFLDRARAVRPAFSVTAANAAAVAQICRALEGIPLALELAASRIAVLTPAQMLGRLAKRLDLLAATRSDLPERHRTLRATIAWSYELLAEPLQRLFARLAVFRGGWTLEAAEQVAASEDLPAETMLDALAELRGASLVTVAEQGDAIRFSMLEVIREYAAERLALVTGGDREMLAERHCAFFSGLALGEECEEECFARIAADYDNVRAVLESGAPTGERARIARALEPFWRTRGMLSEGRRWLRALAAGEVCPAIRAALAGAEGILAWRGGDLPGAEAALQQALGAWEHLGEYGKAAGAINNLGILADERGEFAAATGLYERALGIYRRLGEERHVAAVLSNLAAIALQGERPGDARGLLEEALAIQHRLGERRAAANSLHNLAEMHRRTGDCATARARLAESMELREALGARDDDLAALILLAQIASAEGHAEMAVGLLAAAQAAQSKSEISHGATHAADFQSLSCELRKRLGEERFADAWRRGPQTKLRNLLDAQRIRLAR